MRTDYEIAIREISSYIYHYLPISSFCLGKSRFKEQCYIRWALYEILELVYKESFDIPESMSKRTKPDVFDIIDSFIFKMKDLLSFKYVWAFDVGRRAAIQLKRYLKNTNLF